jgi:hypothetical protein
MQKRPEDGPLFLHWLSGLAIDWRKVPDRLVKMKVERSQKRFELNRLCEVIVESRLNRGQSIRKRVQSRQRDQQGGRF